METTQLCHKKPQKTFWSFFTSKLLPVAVLWLKVHRNLQTLRLLCIYSKSLTQLPTFLESIKVMEQQVLCKHMGQMQKN